MAWYNDPLATLRGDAGRLEAERKSLLAAVAAREAESERLAIHAKVGRAARAEAARLERDIAPLVAENAALDADIAQSIDSNAAAKAEAALLSEEREQADALCVRLRRRLDAVRADLARVEPPVAASPMRTPTRVSPTSVANNQSGSHDDHSGFSGTGSASPDRSDSPLAAIAIDPASVDATVAAAASARRDLNALQAEALAAGAELEALEAEHDAAAADLAGAAVLHDALMERLDTQQRRLHELRERSHVTTGTSRVYSFLLEASAMAKMMTDRVQLMLALHAAATSASTGPSSEAEHGAEGATRVHAGASLSPSFGASLRSARSPRQVSGEAASPSGAHSLPRWTDPGRNAAPATGKAPTAAPETEAQKWAQRTADSILRQVADLDAAAEAAEEAEAEAEAEEEQDAAIADGSAPESGTDEPIFAELDGSENSSVHHSLSAERS